MTNQCGMLCIKCHNNPCKYMDFNCDDKAHICDDCKEKLWTVYLLKCSDDTLYCGITNNLTKRIETHNKGKGAKYTKCRLPVVLIKFFDVKNKSEALKLEYKIKQLSRKDKLKYEN